MPEYVSEYYYWLTAQNTLPKTCLCYIRIIRNYLLWIDSDDLKIFSESLKYPSEYLASKARKKIYDPKNDIEELDTIYVDHRFQTYIRYHKYAVQRARKYHQPLAKRYKMANVTKDYKALAKEIIKEGI